MRPGAPRESGFSLVEIVAVVVVILVLLSIGVLAFRGAKRTTQYKAAASAAYTYADAIEAYMADNGQVPPALGSPEWPAGTREARVNGPINLMVRDPATNKPKRYARAAALEKVLDGLVDFGPNKAGAPPGAAAYITYSVSGGSYTLLVETLPVSPGEAVQTCVVTNATALPSGTMRC